MLAGSGRDRLGSEVGLRAMIVYCKLRAPQSDFEQGLGVTFTHSLMNMHKPVELCRKKGLKYICKFGAALPVAMETKE